MTRLSLAVVDVQEKALGVGTFVVQCSLEVSCSLRENYHESKSALFPRASSRFYDIFSFPSH